MKTLFLLILFFALSCDKESSDSQETLSDTSQAPTEATEAPDDSALPSPMTWTEAFMDLVNAHRISIGRRPLVHRDELAQIAHTHSQNMAEKVVSFGHTGFSQRCTDARDALGGGNWCGENVATGQKTPEAAFHAWMNSPGHRANIEQERATHTGFGYAKSLSGAYYWTQVFLEL